MWTADSAVDIWPLDKGKASVEPLVHVTGAKQAARYLPPAPSLSAPAVGISRLLPTGKAGRVVGIVRPPQPVPRSMRAVSPLCCSPSARNSQEVQCRHRSTWGVSCTHARTFPLYVYVRTCIYTSHQCAWTRASCSRAGQHGRSDRSGARDGLVVRVRASFLRVFARQKPDRGLARFSSAWVRWNQGLNGAERPGIYVRTSYPTLKVVYRL